MAERNLSAFSELLCLDESHLLIVIPALIHWNDDLIRGRHLTQSNIEGWI